MRSAPAPGGAPSATVPTPTSSASTISGRAGDGDGRISFDPPDPRPTPDVTLESLERLRVLATLPASERVALVRTTVDGETVAEVARDLGVSAGRVHTLVHTGSTRLRRRAA